jgi:hypothetical protein
VFASIGVKAKLACCYELKELPPFYPLLPPFLDIFATPIQPFATRYISRSPAIWQYLWARSEKKVPVASPANRTQQMAGRSRYTVQKFCHFKIAFAVSRDSKSEANYLRAPRAGHPS